MKQFGVGVRAVTLPRLRGDGKGQQHGLFRQTAPQIVDVGLEAGRIGRPLQIGEVGRAHELFVVQGQQLVEGSICVHSCNLMQGLEQGLMPGRWWRRVRKLRRGEGDDPGCGQRLYGVWRREGHDNRRAFTGGCLRRGRFEQRCQAQKALMLGCQRLPQRLHFGLDRIDVYPARRRCRHWVGRLACRGQKASLQRQDFRAQRVLGPCIEFELALQRLDDGGLCAGLLAQPLPPLGPMG